MSDTVLPVRRLFVGKALSSVIERVAAGAMATFPASVAAELRAKVPALMLMLPVRGFTLEIVSVPLPILVWVAVVPVMAVVPMEIFPAPA